MLGWEFPPYNQGGLGVACKGIVTRLLQKETNVILALPYMPDDVHIDNCKIIACDTVGSLKIKKICSLLQPYLDSQHYVQRRNRYDKTATLYGHTIFTEIMRYTNIIKEIAQKERFDIIHAHDWMTIQAGMEAKVISNKPLLFHIHATEYDRTGGNGVNSSVYAIEKQGMKSADKVIAVSNFTKQKIITHYGIDPNKVAVIYNGIDHNEPITSHKRSLPGPIILFLGRLTLQKGPDYFVKVAKKILDYRPNVTFIITGSGDMESHIIEEVAALGISENVLFTGHLHGADINRIYQMADIFVMPSVSEPFGLTPLEAMIHAIPTIVSKQSGVSEIINHCLKIDFWDIDQLANQILSILDYPELAQELSQNGNNEVKKICWEKTADQCITLYRQSLGLI